MKLKPFAALTPTEHLQSKCEFHFDPRRPRRVAGGYTPKGS